MPSIGRERQFEFYLGALRGRRPRVPVSFPELERRASEKMSREAFAYVAGGAGAEETVQANRAAFERRRIVPRMLRDVSARDTSIELFGRTLPTPFLLAPIGVLEMAHAEADVAVARAAAAERVPMIFSSQASRSMEECAAAMGDGPRWFQLYWTSENAVAESFVARAEACGCEAIVLTLDTTILGWRVRDLDLAYLPFLRGKGLAQFTSDPAFARLVDAAGEAPALPGRVAPAGVQAMLELARSYPGRTLANLRSTRPRAAVRTWLQTFPRPSLVWEDLAFLRERTRLPLLLKGILHPDDAVRALGHGVDGIVVSNHGGRQIDGSIATLDALPAVVDAVRGRVPVLLDGGIRGGADVFRSLALGAEAVLLGRPYVYGLALGGEAGVREVIRNLAADFDITMGLAGVASPSEITRDAIVEAR